MNDTLLGKIERDLHRYAVREEFIECIMEEMARDARSKEVEDASVEICVLGSYARPVDMELILVALKTTTPLRSEEKGFIIKVPHHFTEPRRSSKAAEYGLGPRVFYASDNYIVEEYFAPEDSLRTKGASLSKRECTAVGKRSAEKVHLMLANDIVHAFDRYPDHTYLIGKDDGIDVKYIDWGRYKSFSSAGDIESLLTGELIQTIVGNFSFLSSEQLACESFKSTLSQFHRGRTAKPYKDLIVLVEEGRL